MRRNGSSELRCACFNEHMHTAVWHAGLPSVPLNTIRTSPAPGPMYCMYVVLCRTEDRTSESRTNADPPRCFFKLHRMCRVSAIPEANYDHRRCFIIPVHAQCAHTTQFTTCYSETVLLTVLFVAHPLPASLRALRLGSSISPSILGAAYPHPPSRQKQQHREAP